MAVAMLTLLVCITVVGCDDDCERRLQTRVTYTGTQAGVFYAREMHEGRVISWGSGSFDPAVSARPAVATSEQCWDEPVSEDVTGYLMEGWLDLDGDDAQLCRDWQSASCQPDPGEPQGRMQFTLKAQGTTDIELSFGDP
jgi:hypothetical protein